MTFTLTSIWKGQTQEIDVSEQTIVPSTDVEEAPVMDSTKNKKSCIGLTFAFEGEVPEQKVDSPEGTGMVVSFPNVEAAPAMGSANIEKSTFKLASVFNGLVPDQKVNSSEQTIVPFEDWMTHKLAGALPGTGVIGLVGPTGSGKMTLLKQVSTLPVQEYLAMQSLKGSDLSKLVSHLQPTLDGKCVWAVPAPHLSEDLVRKMVNRSWQTRIVLISDTKIWGLDNKDVIFHKTNDTFTAKVAYEIKASFRQCQACFGDLRQLQLSVHTGQLIDTVNKEKHPYFDTLAILNSKDRDFDFYNKAWIEQNVLASSNDLEACSSFYEALVCADQNRWIPGMDGCKEDDEEICSIMMKAALPKKTRLGKVEKPHIAQATPNQSYSAYVKNRKRKVAELESTEGNDSSKVRKELNRFDKDFASNCFELQTQSDDRNFIRKRIRTYSQASPPEPSRQIATEGVKDPTSPQIIENNASNEPAETTFHMKQNSDVQDQAEPRQDVTDFLRSGTPEYDFLQGWGIYRTKLREYITEGVASASEPAYHIAPNSLKDCKWLRVTYATSSMSKIAKGLEENIPFIFFDVTELNGGISVFIFKPTQHNIKSMLKIGRLNPDKIEAATFGKAQGRNQAKTTQKDLLHRFQDISGRHMTNMYLGQTADVEEYTAKSLFEAVKHMTPEAFTTFVLQAQLKMESRAELTELERLLCNYHIESRVKELRKLAGKVSTNVIYVSAVKETGQVQPEKAFKSTWRNLLVTVRDKSLMTPLMPREADGRVTLNTFLTFPELHQNVTLFIPGESRKGKTELAKFICLLLAVTYQTEEPRFLMTNTLDSLRTNQSLMLPGVPVLLDDIGGEDNDDQLVHSSISMWKAILQVKDATQNRARNDDLMWAARQPKLLTTNCENLDDWIQTMFPRAKDSHREAIALRTAELQTITESLYAQTQTTSTSHQYLPRQLSLTSASELLDSMF